MIMLKYGTYGGGEGVGTNGKDPLYYTLLRTRSLCAFGVSVKSFTPIKGDMKAHC